MTLVHLGRHVVYLLTAASLRPNLRKAEGFTIRAAAVVATCA